MSDTGEKTSGAKRERAADDLLIVAGKGCYPHELLTGARNAGVGRIGVLAFRGQTDRELCRQADECITFGIGEYTRIRDWLKTSGFSNAVMAGQISPISLFATRFDAESRAILASLKSKSAHSIFGAVVAAFESAGLRMLPASVFMDNCIPSAGTLSAREPDEREMADIRRGHEAALALGRVDVGQTAVVKDGMVLAVEAFEGTNAAIKRGGALGGRGAVVVKVAREGHDMRFDIPVFGHATIKRLVRSRCTALAVQAGRAVFLERERALKLANRSGIAIIAIESGLPPAPLRPTEA